MKDYINELEYLKRAWENEMSSIDGDDHSKTAETMRQQYDAFMAEYSKVHEQAKHVVNRFKL